MNRTGLTLSAVAATLVSLPAAAMLLGLPGATTARASVAPAGVTPAFTTPAASGTCNWAPDDTSVGHPGIPQSPSGDGRATDGGWAAGASHPGPASGPGFTPDAGGSWRQVSMGGWSGPSSPEHSAGSPCDWTPAYHVGAGHSVTALSSTERGRVSYAAWADGTHDGDFHDGDFHGGDFHGGAFHGGDFRGDAFAYGIATNYGGSWHQVSMRGLPKLSITGITVDSFHPAHAYAVYNEDSSRLFHGKSRCGCAGHVFETWNAGRTWTDISGNLPVVVASVLVVIDGRLALATGEGVYTAFESRGEHTCWTPLGYRLPEAEVEGLTVGPDNYIYATTHSRGTWRFRL